MMNPQMQQGAYRPFPPSQTRSPANRRPGSMNPGGPHGQQHPSIQMQQHQQQQQQHHQQQQQRNAALEHQLAQRRARKPIDRNMPDDIEEVVIGDGVQQYKDLREVEKRLDHTMLRKRLDIQDSLSRNVKRQKTMRIWISNTAENQPWQNNGLDENAFDFTSAEYGTYRLKIEGRLLEDDPEDELPPQDSDDEDRMEEEDQETNAKKPSLPHQPRKRLSHFFKSISVDFDRARGIGPEAPSQIEWRKQGPADFDGLTFERKGDENQNVTINFFRDEQPERYRLSQALSQTLDLEEADRAEVVMGIWEYVKVMGLQEDEEKRSVRCDAGLKKIPERIMAHLHPLPPLVLPYTIRVDPSYDGSPTIYDVRVAVDDPLRAKLAAMTQNQEYHATLRQIAQFDDSLALIVQATQHSKARHTFFKSMSKDPVGFVQKWMSSQKRDLEVILGEAARGGGEDGSGVEFQRGGKDGVWDTPVVKEAVRYMLAKPQRP